MKDDMAPLTLFSFGYWGWGNHTPQLVEAVTAAERERGCEAPLFVDSRISRSVRAVGFTGSAFERLLGRDQYLWVPDLGNEAVLEGGGDAIRIRDPRAVEPLLDRVQALAESRRRMILFCSCEHARSEAGVLCHRTTVMQLAREAAERRGLALQTVEWPGGKPTRMEAAVSALTLKQVLRGRVTAPLKSTSFLGAYAALAWGAIVRLTDGISSLEVVSGPVRFQAGAWCLPILMPFAGRPVPRVELETFGANYRRTHMIDPLWTGPKSLKEGPAWSEACIYTILHVDKLAAFHRNGGYGTAREARGWATGQKLFLAARHAGHVMPILFADAADCSRILYRAEILAIDVDAQGTRYAFQGLRPLAGKHAPQELRLLKTGAHIAPHFIRPYAICRTPGFLNP